jgi:hypothetical protein
MSMIASSVPTFAGQTDEHLKMNVGRQSFPAIPLSPSPEDDSAEMLSFPNVIHASSSKVLDPVLLQAWAGTPVITPLAAPITLEEGNFCFDKQHDKSPLIPGHCVSNPAIDQSVQILKKFGVTMKRTP